ncbi:MAG: peptide chain release factor N(5)-glutamine methyltransferase [Hydrogenophaga sp.]|jgi:release factor glutamine methyltransferase|uniref:peptide chain release factor N(5)-glutamine methyltransferase n=1 Tax=Hydrogenophaga sp. TaxID=1904254 RepID=UPI002616C396|nr:peptide chain release factor N(5)-glutamine methyltransferase [Hydrogenophaga sp.]MCV0440006.1 peptide chain release factor N(5)-glutamine methyltransferase [Hydrogenophaga sp.]
MTLREALAHLQGKGLDRIDAQMLLLLALGRGAHERAWLMAHDGDALDASTTARLDALAQRRADGEPMAYLRGDQEFFGLTLQVDARVLVPRSDTETLVSWAIARFDHFPGPTRVLDLGTGSGAIALAIKAQRPAACVFATDASDGALCVARRNAGRLGLAVDFLPGHWIAAVPGQRFHIIASNPPYIAEGDIHLAALGHEPVSALTAGADGLDDIRHIVAHAHEALHPGGWLLLEHGHDQAPAVRELLRAAGFEQVDSRADLAGIARCSGGQWPQRR